MTLSFLVDVVLCILQGITTFYISMVINIIIIVVDELNNRTGSVQGTRIL